MTSRLKLGTLCLASIVLVGCGKSSPAGGTAPGSSSSASTATSSGGSQWTGIYGSGTSANINATLHIDSQDPSLTGTGTLTYDGYEEAVSITSTGPHTLSIKGVSYKDLRGGRTFYLDNFKAEVSADGNSMNATGGDTDSVVANAWLKLQRAGSAPGAR
jgi:hypothetical protein